MAEVHLIGEILKATDFEDRSLFLRWNLNSGSPWQLIEGFSEGQTHLSTASVLDKKYLVGEHYFGHPIDAHFHSTGIQGWPRIEFQVWGVDWFGKCNISAYGFLSVPTMPGCHRLSCATWRPVGDFKRRLLDYLTGYRMQLVDPSDIISNGLNRHVIQSKSMGNIEVELSVVLKDFDKYGIDLCHPSTTLFIPD